jgi:hypothetical protein
MSSSPKAYHGSCHCGAVQYQLRLKFPPVHDPSAESIRIYKCNCTTCQKMGYFHCRPIAPADDFILTAPATIEELGEYRTGSKKTAWYFCKDCGVRVVAVAGVWEQVELDVGEWGGVEKGGEETLQKVWKSKGTTKRVVREGREEEVPYHYLSVNAVTLEPGGEVDLKMWHEKGWIGYVDSRFRKGGMRLGEPHDDGMY